MSRPFDGGPAFPRPASIDTSSGTLPDGDTVVEEQEGVSARDYFAAAALTGIMANPETLRATLTPALRAEAAYKAADAMLAERAKPVPPRE